MPYWMSFDSAICHTPSCFERMLRAAIGFRSWYHSQPNNDQPPERQPYTCAGTSPAKPRCRRWKDCVGFWDEAMIPRFPACFDCTCTFDERRAFATNRALRTLHGLAPKRHASSSLQLRNNSPFIL